MSGTMTVLWRYARLASVIGLWILSQNCSVPTVEPTVPATIQGNVFEKGGEIPIAGATIRILSFSDSTKTNSSGRFSLTIELPDSSRRTVTLIVSKAGFAGDTLDAIDIQNGRITAVAEVELSTEDEVDTPTESGPAANVILVEIETSNIFVKGSGGNETSDLTFEVRDASGTPVDRQHRVIVRFRITGGPSGGGQFLSPDSVQTDEDGRVVTTINAGTIAGALQVTATISGRPITSAPVPIAIHGGLPELSHFSVVPEKLNFAGYNIFGLINPITAFVGDRYSNPVPPGTVVQFRSSGGIIAGSAVTDDLGRATVSLLAAAPQPPGITGFPSPMNEPGFARIDAQTVDENRVSISKNTVVLFSGVTQLGATPTTFDLAPFSSQLFNYTVSDQNSNPLVSGTSISVGTNNGELDGDTGITLEDTQSRFWTRFAFVLTNSEPDSFEVKETTVTIKVSSENGNASALIRGALRPLF